MNKTELARKIQALDGLSNEEKTALLELIELIRNMVLYGRKSPKISKNAFGKTYLSSSSATMIKSTR